MNADDQAFVATYLGQSVAALHAFAADPAQVALLHDMAAAITHSMRAGGKLLLAGNGGSAGDAQHVAAEFTGRMLYDRDPLPALALTTDTSALTAIGNDYGYEKVFERQVRALGREGDVLLASSTSGNSPSILLALDAARAQGMATLGFTGSGGGRMADRADLLLRAPTDWTPVIQQIHITAAHVICSLVERAIYPKT